MDKLHDLIKLYLIIVGVAHLLNRFIDKGLWYEARIFVADAELNEGIPAPVLKDANNAFETESGTDKLFFYTNNNSAYPYVAGMDL